MVQENPFGFILGNSRLMSVETNIESDILCLWENTMCSFKYFEQCICSLYKSIISESVLAMSIRLKCFKHYVRSRPISVQNTQTVSVQPWFGYIKFG